VVVRNEQALQQAPAAEALLREKGFNITDNNPKRHKDTVFRNAFVK